MNAHRHPDDALLHDAATDALPRRMRSRVQQHLATCARCSRLVEQARAGEQLARSVPADLVPAERDADLHSALDRAWTGQASSRSGSRARRAMPGWRRRLNVGLAFGLVAVVLGGVAVTATRSGGGGTADTGAASGVELHQRSQGASDQAPTAASPAAGAAAPTVGRESSADGSLEVSDAVGNEPTLSAPPCRLEIGGVPAAAGPPGQAGGKEISRRPLGPIRSIAVVCYELATSSR